MLRTTFSLYRTKFIIIVYAFGIKAYR